MWVMEYVYLLLLLILLLLFLLLFSLERDTYGIVLKKRKKNPPLENQIIYLPYLSYPMYTTPASAYIPTLP